MMLEFELPINFIVNIEEIKKLNENETIFQHLEINNLLNKIVF